MMSAEAAGSREQRIEDETERVRKILRRGLVTAVRSITRVRDLEALLRHAALLEQDQD